MLSRGVLSICRKANGKGLAFVHDQNLMPHSFANVDMALVSSCQDYMGLQMHYFSYDIACQYYRRFQKRMEKMAGIVKTLKSLKLDEHDPFDSIMLVWAVGKFHLAAHKPNCRYKFSLRFLWGSGRTDGEADERKWAVLNALSLRAREMAAGHRHDTINDFLDALNEVLTVQIGNPIPPHRYPPLTVMPNDSRCIGSEATYSHRSHERNRRASGVHGGQRQGPRHPRRKGTG